MEANVPIQLVLVDPPARKDGLPDFQGPLVQGTPANRFLYVDVGTYAGQKDTPWSRLGNGGRVEVRVEVFNIFNRANFGPPQLIAFAGAADNEQPLASFGRVRSTITSARQMQLGLRVRF